MRHLGDIQKIDGHKVPIVDCVTFGAPCQDLSVAGKRAGMRHKDLGDDEATRSGLFMDAVRIIKEMREQDVYANGRADEHIRPRYAVYENVPGAFSSNKGEDFRIVIEELAKIKDKDAVIPRPDKWQTSGCILGDGWSIAWRVLDAQFWGVPQRRRRIALVADFGGHSAHEILFVRKGVSRDIEQSQPQRKATPADATRGIGADDSNSISYTMKIRSGCDVDANGKAAGKGALIQTEKSGTLSCVQDQYLFHPVYSVENHPADSRVDIDDTGKVQTLTSRMGTGGGNIPMVMEPTVFSKSKRAQNPTDYETWTESDTANTLNTFDQGDVRTNECVIALDRASYNQGKNAQFDIGINESGTAQSLVAKGPGAVCYTVDQGGGKSACNVTEGQAPTLTCTHGGEPAVCYSLDPLSSNSMKSSNPHSGCHETNVARTIDTTYPDPSKNQGGVAVVEQRGAFYPQMKAESNCFRTDGISNCLVNGTNPGYQNGLAIASVDCRNGTESDVNATLQMGAFRSLNCNNVVRTRYTVRRLTPLECERLQGYPDGWTDIGEYIDSNGKKKQSSDAARYKALGNSIALPPWKWVMKRLCACYERDATLASLFDGIGGFPLIWEQINGKGSCLWASEIEEFPIAVTKVRIGE